MFKYLGSSKQLHENQSCFFGSEQISCRNFMFLEFSDLSFQKSCLSYCASLYAYAAINLQGLVSVSFVFIFF